MTEEDQRRKIMLKAWGTVHSIIKVNEHGYASIVFPDGTTMTGGRAFHNDDGELVICWPDGRVTRGHSVKRAN